MKKVLLAALLILALSLSFAACGGKTTGTVPAETKSYFVPHEEPKSYFVQPEAPKSYFVQPEAPKSYFVPNSYFVPHETTAATEAPAVDNGQNGAGTAVQGTPGVQSSASFEDFVRSYYYTCQSLADDGIVRDYFTKSPIGFSYNGEDVVWYAYKSGDEYRSVYISSYGGDPGSYQVTWG